MRGPLNYETPPPPPPKEPFWPREINIYVLGFALIIVGSVLVFTSENPPGRARYTASGTFGLFLIFAGAASMAAKWVKSDDGPY